MKLPSTTEQSESISSASGAEKRSGREPLWKVCTAALAALATGMILFFQGGEMSNNVPRGNLPGWKQTAVQDFLIPAEAGQLGGIYGEAVRGYSSFADSSGHGLYTPDSVLTVRDGKLDYYLHSSDGKPRVASVVPFGYEGQTYGRYSIRFRYDRLPGFKIAFLLWPSSDDWNEGEIDWPEGGLDGHLYGGSAVKGSLVDGSMKFDPPDRRYSPSGPGSWHVATTEWTPGEVRWFMDGNLIGQTRISSGVPDTPMRLTLQAETADDATDTFPGSGVAGHLQVDWVVQYAYAP